MYIGDVVDDFTVVPVENRACEPLAGVWNGVGSRLEVEEIRRSVTVTVGGGVVVNVVIVVVVIVVGVVRTKDGVVEPIRCGLELVGIGIRFGVRVG